MKSIITTIAQTLFALFLYALGVLILGLAIFPGALLIYFVFIQTAGDAIASRVLMLCFSLVTAYFLHGLVLIFLVGVFRILFRLKLREAEYPMASLGSAKWFITNALQTLVSITFMDFILLTPFASLFYRFMGAKLGKNVQINSKFCADLSLLEIGDGAVIGGHATVIGHLFEHNKLILKKVKIGRRAVVGLNSIIMPGAEIGDGALIAAGAVVPKDAKIAPGSVYFGIVSQKRPE